MNYKHPTLNPDNLPISQDINGILIKYSAALNEIQKLKEELDLYYSELERLMDVIGKEDYHNLKVLLQK